MYYIHTYMHTACETGIFTLLFAYSLITNLLYFSLKKSVSCRGKPEDCLMLATSIVDGVKWLVQVSIRVMVQFCICI